MSSSLDALGLRIRAAEEDEFPILAALKARAFRAAYLPLIGLAAYEAFLLDATAEWFTARVAEGHEILVAERNHEIIGLAVYGPNTLDAPAGRELRNVYIDPDSLSGGIGRALVEESLRRMSAEGVRVVSLGVFPSNHRAITFYERCGFRRHKEATFTKRGVEFADQIMIRELNSPV